MKIKHLMIAGAATLMAGCAHAGGFSGTWAPLRSVAPLLIVTNLGNGHYSAEMKRQVPGGSPTTIHWRVAVVYELTRHGDQLEGHIQHLAMVAVSLNHKGPGEIVLRFPGASQHGQPVVFRRSH